MSAPPDDQKNLSPDPIERMTRAYVACGSFTDDPEKCMVAAVKALMAHFEEKGTDSSTPPQRGYLYGVVSGLLEVQVLEAHEQRETDDRES